MRVYFVRHGESHGNAGTNSGETDRDQLTDSGWEQAQQLGKRLAGITFSRIYASPMRRAQETAAAIAEHVDAPTVCDTDIHELIWFTGGDRKLSRAEAVQLYFDHWETMAGLPLDKRIEDTESFSEIRDRALRFLARAEQHQDDKPILVVSHGGFLRFILGWSLMRGQFGPAQLRDLLLHAKTTNTGISEFDFSPERGWQLHTWMDQAHL
jgi:broad specificity phosphatase PhoE